MKAHWICMTGDQEPTETLTSSVIIMCSNLIFPCPSCHCCPARSSNGNSCLASANTHTKRAFTTHITLGLEGVGVPLDTLGDFLDEHGLGYYTSAASGGNLRMHLSAETVLQASFRSFSRTRIDFPFALPPSFGNPFNFVLTLVLESYPGN